MVASLADANGDGVFWSWREARFSSIWRQSHRLSVEGVVKEMYKRRDVGTGIEKSGSA